MARPKPIKTVREFYDAMEAIPSLRLQLRSLDDQWCREVQSNPYLAWKQLLVGCDEAVRSNQLRDLPQMFGLYDRAMAAGERGEMRESSYVAFLEDIKLPADPQERRRLMAHMGPQLRADLARDRGFMDRPERSRFPRSGPR